MSTVAETWPRAQIEATSPYFTRRALATVATGERRPCRRIEYRIRRGDRQTAERPLQTTPRELGQRVATTCHSKLDASCPNRRPRRCGHLRHGRAARASTKFSGAAPAAGCVL